MKRPTWLSILIPILLGISACEANAPRRVDADEVNREATEAFDTAEQYAAQEAAEFVAQSKEKIAQLENRAEAWKARTQDLGEEARAATRKELAELEAKTAEARQHLEEFKGNSQRAWDEFRRDAESALAELQQAYDRAAPRFGDGG